MKTPHPIVATLEDIRDLVYRLGREWEATVEEIEDPDASEALTIALAKGYPLGKDINDLAAELDSYLDHVRQTLDNLPTVLQLVAAEIEEDNQKLAADLTERDKSKSTDEAYQDWQTGGLGGEPGRIGGIFTPTVTAQLSALLLAIDGGDTELIQKNADRLGRAYRSARRQSHT